MSFFRTLPVFVFMALALLIALPVSISAAVMSSSNYQMQSDSINVGGGDASSSNYTTRDSIGEFGTGISSSTNYTVNAGYRPMLESSITITGGGTVVSPAMSGITNGVSTTSASWIVTTDNLAGYQLFVQATSSPALQSPMGYYFSDYTPGANPSYNFTIAATSSAFGFSPEGTDIIAKYKNNPGVQSCNPGSGTLVDDPNACWDGLSTSTKLVSQGSTNNQPNGATTTIKFRAAIGSQKVQEAGSYSATITVTAVTL